MGIIIKPIVTEKLTAQGENLNRYGFIVDRNANKLQIKEAVEKMFAGTKVASVNTMNLDGKTRRRGNVFGKTAKMKKAIVQLTADSAEIEVFAGL